MKPHTCSITTANSAVAWGLPQQEATPRDQRVAHRFGDWQLAETLSVGELTATYTAHPFGATPACHYVVKTLAENTPYADLARTLLQREAFVCQEVSHPHLIPILDSQLREPPYFLVTPYLIGTTLRTLLNSVGKLDVTTSLWVTRQVAQGLAALHSRNWMHADIKPENIFLAPDGHVTLIDLGFARHFKESGSACNRRIQGTFNYIAPETITSAHRTGAACDIYSLGATLYEMLAGKPPFQERTLADLARAHREQRPKSLCEILPETGEALSSLVVRMLAKQPVRRESSTPALIDQLVKLEIDGLARCA